MNYLPTNLPMYTLVRLYFLKSTSKVHHSHQVHVKKVEKTSNFYKYVFYSLTHPQLEKNGKTL